MESIPQSTKRFDQFTLSELRNMKSDDYRQLSKKKILEFSDKLVKNIEKLPDEEIIIMKQAEIKNLTTVLTNFHDQCIKDNLPTREFEDEAVKFITDKYKRVFFASKIAQRLYAI